MKPRHAGVLAATLRVAGGWVHAAYPERAIRIIVPYAPGGNIDITARIVAPGMAEALGAQVVIDNRGGTGGTIGTEVAAKAAPDGYTLLLGSTGTLATSPALYPNVGFDPVKDFAPTSLVIVVHPALPAIPTLDESGLKAFDVSTTTGIMLPAATPQDIVAKVHAALVKTLRLPATRENFARIGADVLESSAEEFSRTLRMEIAKWSKVIRDANIKAE